MNKHNRYYYILALIRTNVCTITIEAFFNHTTSPPLPLIPQPLLLSCKLTGSSVICTAEFLNKISDEIKRRYHRIFHHFLDNIVILFFYNY